MFSDKLKELRKNKGMYQKDLADALSISKGAIAMWETGKRTPDIEMLKRIAEYFQVSVDYLVDGTFGNEAECITDNDIKFALFNGIEGITDEMYEEVKSFAEYVKSREEKKRRDKK